MPVFAVTVLPALSWKNFAGFARIINVFAKNARSCPVKGRGLVRSGDRYRATDIFRFVEVNRAVHSIATMCRVLGVSPSGYYAWRQRGPSQRQRTDEVLSVRLKTLHKRSGGTYGAPRLHADLKDEHWCVGRKRIARLMREVVIQGVSRRKGVFTTVRDERRRGDPDLVKRDFSAEAPDELYVADITYIPTWAGFLYLAIVLDVFSRRVIGWAMATHMKTELVLDALEMALWQPQPDDVIHHSDQGCQYTSIAFGHRCREHGVRPSTGSVGDCFDNAMAESFFATLECELLDRRRFRNPTEARLEVFRFIEGWYNLHRRHSAIGQVSPVSYERMHAEHAHELKSGPVH